MKKRALLAVAGGRCLPDILALQYVNPELVVILTSEEGYQDEATFVSFANTLPNHQTLLPTINVPSYDLEQIKQACIEICRPYSTNEWDWIFSVGSCPKIMAFGAYEVAQDMQIPCVYIDSTHEKIISFVKDIGVAPQNFFHMSVDEYMKIYRREQKPLTQHALQYREYVEKRKHLAQTMASSDETSHFIKAMLNTSTKAEVELPAILKSDSPLLVELEKQGAIKTHMKPDGRILCQFANDYFAKFLGNRDWLEIYVWDEVKKADFADDVQWGYMFQSTAANELDTILTYKAQLIVVECKTDENPFHKKAPEYVNGISGKADILGKEHVTKVFVTNASKKQKGYANFWEQATLRHIIVVTAEDLPDIGNILKKQAINPDYPRR